MGFGILRFFPWPLLKFWPVFIYFGLLNPIYILLIAEPHLGVPLPEMEKVVDPANLVHRKYSEKPGLAENI